MTLVRSPDAIAKIATPNHRLPLLWRSTRVRCRYCVLPERMPAG